jgi:hypothetical protein
LPRNDPSFIAACLMIPHAIGRDQWAASMILCLAEISANAEDSSGDTTLLHSLFKRLSLVPSLLRLIRQ